MTQLEARAAIIKAWDTAPPEKRASYTVFYGHLLRQCPRLLGFHAEGGGDKNEAIRSWLLSARRHAV